jgi:hypothetical protein
MTLALVILATAPAAGNMHPTPALEPGVHVDPGSPAGKEYQIPLGAARGVAGPSGLFGSGITKGPSGSRQGGSPDASGVPGGGPAPAPSGARGAPRPGGRVAGARHRSQGHGRGRSEAAGGAVGSGGPGAGGASPPAAGRSAELSGLSGTGLGGFAWMLTAAVVVVALGVAGGQLLTRTLRRRGLGADSEW